MNQIKISVIIPVYNIEKYINECLESIFEQKKVCLEVICINDGSTDQSEMLLEKYAIKKSNMYIISQDNRGQSCARNRGLLMAKGEYVYFLDGDDKIAHDDDLYCVVSEMEKEHLDFLEFDGKSFFSSEELRNRNKDYEKVYVRNKSLGKFSSGTSLFHELNINGMYYCSPSLRVYRRKFLLDNSLFFTEGIVYEDQIHTLECFINAQRVEHINRTILLRRLREESTTQSVMDFYKFYSCANVYIRLLELWKDNKNELLAEDFHSLCITIRDNANNIWRRLPYKERSKIENIESYMKYLIKNTVLDRRYPVNGVDFPYVILMNTDALWIYGAGRIGKNFYYQLMEDGVIHVEGIVDKRGEGASDDNITVFGLDYISEHTESVWLIAIEDEDVANEAKELLLSKGVANEKILWDGKLYINRNI